MTSTGHIDHNATNSLDVVDEEIRQEKVAEMVDGELELDAVLREGIVLWRKYTGAIDQAIDAHARVGAI